MSAVNEGRGEVGRSGRVPQKGNRIDVYYENGILAARQRKVKIKWITERGNPHHSPPKGRQSGH